MRVIETSLDEDLSLFSAYLRQQRVAHRVFEERGAQVLELHDPALAESVRAAYGAWKSGNLSIERVPRPVATRSRPRWPRALARYPGLTLLIVLALLAFPFSLPLAGGELTTVAAWLAIADPRMALTGGSDLPGLLADLQVWRWITPIFLHFSVLHLAFNCAVTIELGRRVEGEAGTAGFWLLVLGLAVASNLTQFAFSGGILFGGLSGVAYGLLGFVLAMQALERDLHAWQLPRGIAAGLLVFLVIFTTGITEPFGLFVANAAHWSGLIAGAVLAVGAARWRASRA